MIASNLLSGHFHRRNIVREVSSLGAKNEKYLLRFKIGNVLKMLLNTQNSKFNARNTEMKL